MTEEQANRIEAKLDRLLAMNGPKQPHDDEKIFKDPSAKYWPGRSYKDAKLSVCPADFLRAYAKYKDACAFMARKEADPEKAKYADRDAKSAALARAWADFREASGDSPLPVASPPTGSEDDLIPF
jgi:hypothetical protein